MPGTAKGTNVKLRLKYKGGSQTLSNCKETAEDKDLFTVGAAIADLKKDEGIQIVKIVETDLVAD